MEPEWREEVEDLKRLRREVRYRLCHFDEMAKNGCKEANAVWSALWSAWSDIGNALALVERQQRQQETRREAETRGRITDEN